MPGFARLAFQEGDSPKVGSISNILEAMLKGMQRSVAVPLFVNHILTNTYDDTRQGISAWHSFSIAFQRDYYQSSNEKYPATCGGISSSAALADQAGTR